MTAVGAARQRALRAAPSLVRPARGRTATVRPARPRPCLGPLSKHVGPAPGGRFSSAALGSVGHACGEPSLCWVQEQRVLTEMFGLLRKTAWRSGPARVCLLPSIGFLGARLPSQFKIEKPPRRGIEVQTGETALGPLHLSHISARIGVWETSVTTRWLLRGEKQVPGRQATTGQGEKRHECVYGMREERDVWGNCT